MVGPNLIRVTRKKRRLGEGPAEAEASVRDEETIGSGRKRAGDPRKKGEQL